MTRLQLNAVAEVYGMLNKGMTHPIKINQAYKYINPMTGIEVPMRAKILAINRFMQLSYADVVKQLDKEAEVKEMIELTESIGTIENKDRQTHTEKVDSDNDIQQFLTKKEKEQLKSPEAGTTLEIVESNGKKKRTRSPNGTRKAR